MDATIFALCYKGVVKYFCKLCQPNLPARSGHSGVRELAMAEKAPKAAAASTLADVSTTDTLPDPRIFSDSSASSSSLLEDRADFRGHLLQQEIELRMEAAAASMGRWPAGDFELVQTLQEAPRNQGSVMLMRSLATGGNFVAVKKMPNSWVTSGPSDHRGQHPYSSERPWMDIALVRYLHDMDFEFVCEPRGVFRDWMNTYVVTSFATCGDLFSWMEQGPAPGPERELLMRPILVQLFSAMRQLHNFGIAHRDISLENILLTQDSSDGLPKLKLIDFGMASFSRKVRGSSGKRSYVAPELYLEDEHDAYLCDIFALGVVVFALAARAYPWDSTRPGACRRFDFVAARGFRAYVDRRRIARAENAPRMSEVLTTSFIDLLEALLQIKPEDRAALGEHCWRLEAENVTKQATGPRRSVWDMAWMQVEG
eukprot:CAMPEP_0115232182 /NCGR_PEP_ID=MMETSP0270-20121206/33631_1 /TAXON_ID=71861 /ORGANISM="Scrippsiella trochoidea, Strain CCMP3099" /LENGTH=426 /DNA_ID=CAMNT_0002646861 /DNA_START=32 /DNA_END=1312 /DNA_ORIENTATION=-